MNSSTAPSAIIYCRAASALQGDAPLKRQEACCREYAAQRGYAVSEVFSDNASSGADSERPGFEALLTYVRSRPAVEKPVVIVEDIERLARGMRIYQTARAAIELAGGTLESPNFVPAQTPEERLGEDILASVDAFNARLDQEEEAAEAR